MAGKKCRVRVRCGFIVPICRLLKGRYKIKRKEYREGEWLKGDFVEIHGRRMFRTGKFLLSPSHFDRVKFPEGDGMNPEKLDKLLKSDPVPDLYDPHKIFV